MEKIGIVTPTRGDRPEFLKQCIKYMGQQTRKPDYMCIVDYAPKSKNKDLVERCKVGIEDCLKNDCDIIFFIEDDDYYSPIYIQSMYQRWEEVGKPELFGINQSIYYHLKTKRYWEKTHSNHSSLMSTLITKELAAKIDYSKVKDIWFDVYLWSNFKGVSTQFKYYICAGIKHGIGLSGGIGHNPNAGIYNRNDHNGELLRNIVGINNYRFYNDLL
jgi:hypothetical protein